MPWVQAVNVWMGASAAGASSGLHHDFHDNLYVLLRGTKRFRLFPPAMAARMYTHGAVDRIHPNGRCAPTPASITHHSLIHLVPMLAAYNDLVPHSPATAEACGCTAM